MTRNINKNSNGFTLIEILISITIVSGLIFLVGTFGLDLYDFGIFLGDNIISQQELQVTIRVMVSEIRAMTQSVNGAYPIESASQNSIVFYSDGDGDGLVERIRYFLEGDIIKKGVIEPSGNPLDYSGNEEISEKVHNVYIPAGNIFSYYGEDYSGTQVELAFPTNIPSVRLIKLNMTVDPNPWDEASRINFSSAINIRNL